MQDKLGSWLHQDYNMWDWRHDIENCRLLHIKGKSMDTYVSSNLPGTRNTPNRWIRQRIDQETRDQGKLCTSRDAELEIKAVESMSNPPERQVMSDSLLEVLRE